MTSFQYDLMIIQKWFTFSGPLHPEEVIGQCFLGVRSSENNFDFTFSATNHCRKNDLSGKQLMPVDLKSMKTDSGDYV